MMACFSHSCNQNPGESLPVAGLYYGYHASEASLCANEHVFVVEGGNSAGQAAMHFSRLAGKVSIVIRGDFPNIFSIAFAPD